MPTDTAADIQQMPSSVRGRRRGKLRLLTRANLDSRTKAAKRFDAIAQGIANDLGGEEHLSTIQRHLIEGFAGCALHVQDLNARLLLGAQVDLTEHSQVLSTMVRLASRLGLGRVAREVPSLDEYLRHLQQTDETDHGADHD